MVERGGPGKPDGLVSPCTGLSQDFTPRPKSTWRPRERRPRGEDREKRKVQARLEVNDRTDGSMTAGNGGGAEVARRTADFSGSGTGRDAREGGASTHTTARRGLYGEAAPAPTDAAGGVTAVRLPHPGGGTETGPGRSRPRSGRNLEVGINPSPRGRPSATTGCDPT